MKICGISIDGNNANICVIQNNKSNLNVIDTGHQRFTLDDDTIQENISSFYEVFESFINENQIDMVGIKARMHKGKFAGGALSFKIESLIQLISKEVHILSSQTIKSKTKKIDIPKLFKYQYEAFKTAYTLMIKND